MVLVTHSAAWARRLASRRSPQLNEVMRWVKKRKVEVKVRKLRSRSWSWSRSIMSNTTRLSSRIRQDWLAPRRKCVGGVISIARRLLFSLFFIRSYFKEARAAHVQARKDPGIAKRHCGIGKRRKCRRDGSLFQTHGRCEREREREYMYVCYRRVHT